MFKALCLTELQMTHSVWLKELNREQCGFKQGMSLQWEKKGEKNPSTLAEYEIERKHNFSSMSQGNWIANVTNSKI